MKRLFVLFVLPLAAMALPAGGFCLEAPRQGFQDGVKELESFFPPVEGYVVSLAGDTVYTDVPSSKGLRQGSELLVYREGGEIIHPLTRQVLGRYESEVGVIRVTQVRSEYAAGVIAEKKDGIKPGDRVRISGSRLRALVLSPAPGADGERYLAWQNEVFYALEKSSRFAPVQIKELAGGEGVPGAAGMKELARAAGADEVVFLEAAGGAGERFLTLRLFSGATGETVAVAKVPLQQGAAPAAASPGGGAAPILPSRAEPSAPGPSGWGIFDLDYHIVGLCYGNLTGSGEGQAAVTDGTAIRVYARDGYRWRPLWEDRGRTVNRILSLDCGDLDGNGRDEIFVTRITQGLATSRVLSFQGGEFAPTGGDRNLFYRIVGSGGAGAPRLFAQEYSSVAPGDRPVREYVWDGKDYVPKAQDLPKLTDVYGFDLEDVDGDGEPEWIFLDDGTVSMYRASGARLWSGEKFGGSANFLDAETMGQNPGLHQVGGYLVKGRLLGADVDGDKRAELILYRNVPKLGILQGLYLFDKVQLGIYKWDGLKMAPMAPPEEIPGYLADYALARDGGGGLLLLVGLDDPASFFREGKGKIISRPLRGEAER